MPGVSNPSYCIQIGKKGPYIGASHLAQVRTLPDKVLIFFSSSMNKIFQEAAAKKWGALVS